MRHGRGMFYSGSPVDFITSLLWSGNKVKPDAPLPFAILRSILVELIDAKLESLASSYELPDVTITFNDPTEESKTVDPSM